MASGGPQGPSNRSWMTALVVVAVVSYVLGSRWGIPSLNTKRNASIAGVTSVASVRGVGSSAPFTVSKTVDFNQFWDLWTMLKTKYYKQPLDEQKMLYGAMSGLAASTGDPYTVFFEPVLATEFSQSLEGKFEGIGAEIGIKNEQLQVVAPLPETPASKAGLRAGDAILAIDATSTEGMSVDHAVSLIRGKKGTTVVLTIGRVTEKKPERLDVSIVRDTIKVKSVRWKMVKDHIAHIEINHFNSDTIDEFSKSIDAALEQGATAIILDLRSDPGGLLDRATAVAGEWLGDSVVVRERRQGKIVDEYHGTGKNRLHGMPTIVLVDGGSASASEIVAGALQDANAAKLVGTKTFGKGSVQDYTELKDGTALKVTVAEWLTPNGRAINDIGIEPDVSVSITEEDIHAQRDPQLDKAIELLTGASASSSR